MFHPSNKRNNKILIFNYLRFKKNYNIKFKNCHFINLDLFNGQNFCKRQIYFRDNFLQNKCNRQKSLERIIVIMILSKIEFKKALKNIENIPERFVQDEERGNGPIRQYPRLLCRRDCSDDSV